MGKVSSPTIPDRKGASRLASITLSIPSAIRIPPTTLSIELFFADTLIPLAHVKNQ